MEPKPAKRKVGKKSPKRLKPKSRLDLVEQELRSGDWGEAKVLKLMKLTGASRITIYRDRKEILAKISKEEAETLPERREAFLLDLRAARKQAMRHRAFGPAVRTLAMEAQVQGLDRVPLPDVEEPQGEVDTSLEGVLAEVRKLRRRAMAGDSYVAAEKLLEREAALVESIRQRNADEDAKKMAHLTDEEKINLVVESFRSLPDGLRARVLTELTA